MRAAGALILVIACSAPEAPAPPPARRQVQAPPKLQTRPPVAPRSWQANLLISGGLRGGMRMVTVGPEDRRLRCSPQLAKAVTRAVAEAHPETWQRVYKPPKPGMTDQSQYAMTLNANGKTYETEWDSEGHDLLPPDLRALADLLIAAQGELGKRCP